jgi:hypothetical protein
VSGQPNAPAALLPGKEPQVSIPNYFDRRFQCIWSPECRTKPKFNANKSFRNMAKFKCVEKAVTDQNCIHEKIKSGLN